MQDYINGLIHLVYAFPDLQSQVPQSASNSPMPAINPDQPSTTVIPVSAVNPACPVPAAPNLDMAFASWDDMPNHPRQVTQNSFIGQRGKRKRWP